MYLSRIKINNFRNFSNLDVKLAGNIVVVGENGVGKSNLLYALRVLLDPTLPENARDLKLTDFWNDIAKTDSTSRITISVEFQGFEDNPATNALLGDYRDDIDHRIARLTCECRVKSDIAGLPQKDSDLETIFYGGDQELTRLEPSLRRRILLELLPALRDAESELQNWSRSPLRPLLESAYSSVTELDLLDIQNAVDEAAKSLTGFPSVSKLETDISTLFEKMSGPNQHVEPQLGLGPTDINRLYRNIRLLIDGGKRQLNEASLGSANIMYLTLKLLDLKRRINEDERDQTFLAIEEPEAHLSTHLQRSVYRHLFEKIGIDEPTTSVLLTTHSPQIASVAPLRSLVLLKKSMEQGTVGHSTAAINLTTADEQDLTRYLDVTRAEMLFARGIILVEGDAEKFLLPEFAKQLGYDLDYLGITVCSVSGTHFTPYAKLLSSLGIPFSILTDWDPRTDGQPRGQNRITNLVETIATVKTPKTAPELTAKLKAIKDVDKLKVACQQHGVFTNNHTLEVDLFHGGLKTQVIETLREKINYRATTVEAINQWEKNSAALNSEKYLKIIEGIGKGRFAQRLASRLNGIKPPHFIHQAIQFVVDNVQS